MTENELLQELPETPVEIETTTTQDEGVTVNVTIQQPEPVVSDPEATLLEGETMVETFPEVAAAYSVTSPGVPAAYEPGESDPVMVDVITNILGEYQRQTYTVEQYDSNGDLIAVSTEYVPGLAGLDYAWITGAVFFGIVLAAVFKMLGGLIRS